MKLWGGRFTKEINQLAYQLNASIGFDQRLYKQDIEGSLAHVTMLAKQGILADDERDAIINGLKSILADLENQTLQIDDSSEDIHSFVEETSYRTQPQRSSCPGYETLYSLGDYGTGSFIKRTAANTAALNGRTY